MAKVFNIFLEINTTLLHGWYVYHYVVFHNAWKSCIDLYNAWKFEKSSKI